MASDPSGAPVPARVRMSDAQEFVMRYMEHPDLGGIVIPTHVDVPVGTKVDLTIDLGGGKGIRAIGQVQWLRPASGTQTPGMGVRFVQMAAAHRDWLAAAIKSFGPRAEPTGDDRHLLRKATSAKELEGGYEDLSQYEPDAAGGAIMGIDLGTCNCSACIYVDDKPVIINLADDDALASDPRTLPSVVGYDDNGAATIGQKAMEGLPRNPRRTVYGAKRFIGRAYDSAAVQSMLARFPYKVIPGSEGKVAIDINGRAVNLTSISAKILQTIRQRAEKQMGGTIERAIITVPAYYNDNQRNAVVQAGRLAGLKVERILNEPTAAAIAYGLLRTKPRRILVYDLGGGTFDVSVMTVNKDQLQVLATAGDTFLGGEDFDDVLVKYAFEQFFAKNKKPLSQSPANMAVIKLLAEGAKRRLSIKDSAMITAREVLLADGTPTRMEVEVQRTEFEKRIEPLVSRTLKICDMALRECQLEPDALGDVILVGGQTRMPYVQQRVRDHFKIAPRVDLNPDEVVALGAGMLAHLPKGEGEKFKDVLSMSIGVALAGRFKQIIPRNTTLPCTKQVKLSISKAEWHTYSLDVWQGDAPELHKNEQLGTLKVDIVQLGSKDPVPLCVDFVLTADCLLKVRITNTETEETQAAILNTRDSA